MAPLKSAALFLAVALASCGGSLVNGSYRGTPLVTLLGHADDRTDPVSEQRQTARVAVFWNPGGTQTAASTADLIEQPSTGLTISIPGSFEWSLYDPPPAQVLATTSGGGTYAIGVPMLYYDTNGDFRHESNESLVADSPIDVILYAPKDLDAESSPTGFPVSAGYHLVLTPLSCGPATPAPPHADTCGVKLGSPCASNSDCGTGGVCLTTDPFPWPGGYCAITASPTGCHPKNGQLFRNPHDATQAWWVLACKSDADCGRGVPYQCDVSRDACLATAQIPVMIETPKPPRLCSMSRMPPPGGSGP